jgi:hypothetical protein
MVYSTRLVEFVENKFTHSVTKRDSENPLSLFYKSSRKDISLLHLNMTLNFQSEVFYRHQVDIDEFGTLSTVKMLWIYSTVDNTLSFICKKKLNITKSIKMDKIVMDCRSISNDGYSILM